MCLAQAFRVCWYFSQTFKVPPVPQSKPLSLSLVVDLQVQWSCLSKSLRNHSSPVHETSGPCSPPLVPSPSYPTGPYLHIPRVCCQVVWGLGRAPLGACPPDPSSRQPQLGGQQGRNPRSWASYPWVLIFQCLVFLNSLYHLKYFKRVFV